MLTKCATYTDAVVAIVKREGFPNAPYTMRQEDANDECLVIVKGMLESEQDKGALLAGEFATHLIDGGLHTVIHVEQSDAYLSPIWVWMDDEGDILRAYI